MDDFNPNVEMEVLPYPWCCGAAILVGFGYSSSVPKYYGYRNCMHYFDENGYGPDAGIDYDTEEYLFKRFDEIMDAFVGIQSGGFKEPFVGMFDSIAGMRAGYLSAGRYQLQAYLTPHQAWGWEERLKKTGWKQVSEFDNKKGTPGVQLWVCNRVDARKVAGFND